MTISNPTPIPVQQPTVVVQQQPDYAFIVSVNDVLNNHDFATIAPHFAEYVNYFGHRDASRKFVANDMAGDLRTYAWTKSLPNLASYSGWVDNRGQTHESIQVETWAQEYQGRRHHAHCILSLIRYDTVIESLDLLVIPSNR
jgi:hypothetical protein